MKNFEEYFESVKKFDRVEFYEDYYKNLSPSDFRIYRDKDIIKIKISDKLNENHDEWDWEEENINTLDYYVKISIEKTRKNDEEIKTAIKRGIYWGLDVKGISSPSGINIKIK